MSIVGRMRMKLLITISILAAALQIAPVAFTQGRQRGGGGGERGMAAMSNLTQEERQKLMAARRTAMQDPAVMAAKEKMQAAQKEMHDAMDAALLKADPSLKPILDKMPKGQRERHMQGGESEQ
jgi:Spy/CpxP family protein refolding chaperone